MEEVAKEAYIGGSDEAQEGEDEGVDRDHFLIWFLGFVGSGSGRGVLLWIRATRTRASLVQCSMREEKVGE